MLSSFGFIWLELGETEVENHNSMILHVQSQFTSWKKLREFFKIMNISTC